jgi:hypothetical protein
MAKIPYSIRDRHIHILGKTGYGKTTVLARGARNDISSREGGVGVIDPKGGVGGICEILSRFIPDDRENDCIWLDINDPVPIDLLSCPRGEEEAVVKDLTYILCRGDLDFAQAPDLSTNIENLLYTFLNANQHPRIPDEDRCTFIDIYRFFREEDRQKKILSYVTDPTFLADWDKEHFPKATDQHRIMTRINEFAKSPTMRTILGEPRPRLNLEDVIENRKILLITAPEGHPASSFYGSLLVSKIQHAAFSRRRTNIAEDERIPFFLFIDEFETFRASKEFSKMLKIARSYKLCLTLANLQLSELDADVRSALRLISTFILLKLDPEDEAKFTGIIGNSNPQYEAIMRKRENTEERERHAWRDWKYNKTDAAWTRWLIATEELSEIPEPLKNISAADAPNLPRFHAIYKVGDRPPVIEPTPKQPPKKPTPEQIAKLVRIKVYTLEHYGPTDANYARIILKRTGDNAPLLSRQVLQDEVNDQAQRKSETIAPSGSARIQMDDGKTKRP